MFITNREVLDNTLYAVSWASYIHSWPTKIRDGALKREHLQKEDIVAVRDGQRIVLDKLKRSTKREERALRASQIATAALLAQL
jgi:hypothetical protein